MSSKSSSGGPPRRPSLEPVAAFGQTAPTSPSRSADPATPFQQRALANVPVAPLASVARGTGAVSLLRLAWLDPSVGKKLRRRRDWREIVDALETQSTDVELDAAMRDEHPLGDDARAAFEVLAAAEPRAAGELTTLLREAVRPDGKLLPPLVMVGGNLAMPFDPTARLAMTCAVLAPLAATQPPLSARLESARALVAASVAEAGVAGLLRELLETARNQLPNLPQGHYENAIESELQKQRAYQAREVLGDRFIRGLLSGHQPIPCYLPHGAARELPLAVQITVRMIAEILPRQDEAEPAPICLRVLGLARETPLAELG